MNLSPWFITATDTDAGKTWMSVQILHKLRAQNRHAVGIKPIASGGRSDQIALQNASSIDLGEKHGLYVFEPAIAPHFAAQLQHTTIEIARIQKHITDLQKIDLQAYHPVQMVIEGAGGWRVPLNETEEWRELVQQTDWKVIVVVGIKLGCLNHALLTAESLCTAGITVLGWLPNVGAHPDPYAAQMIETLRARIPFCMLSSDLSWVY